jgi:hypothetical protein
MLLIVLALVGGALITVPAVREPALRAAGWALVVDEPVGVADIIVVSLDSGGAGALEAADLVQGGIATRVAVFTAPRMEKISSSSGGGSLTRMQAQGKFASLIGLV